MDIVKFEAKTLSEARDEETGPLLWYQFRQNNSGGYWDINEKVGIEVWVEAANAKGAERVTEELGLFEGGSGNCPCCGDRWYFWLDDDDGEVAPNIGAKNIWGHDNRVNVCHLYFANGEHVACNFIEVDSWDAVVYPPMPPWLDMPAEVVEPARLTTGLALLDDQLAGGVKPGEMAVVVAVKK